VYYNAPVRILTLIVLVLASSHPVPSWQIQTSGLDTNLRGISVTTDGHSGKHIVWASGSNGVILRSTDDSKRWTQLHVAGGETLDFRDVQVFGNRTAYVMSSGDGNKSRIYKTTNAGQTWELQYTDKRPGFFLDSLACDSEVRCYALSDPVDGKFLILTTSDGQHWKELPRDKMPPALPAEGILPRGNSFQ